jgi:hypothetical protein
LETFIVLETQPFTWRKPDQQQGTTSHPAGVVRGSRTLKAKLKGATSSALDRALMWYSWDEHTITGFSAPSGWWNSVAQWATWATDIDIRIDGEQIMRKLAEKYADSFKHLVALYAVTTQVTRKDAAALADVTPWNWHKTYEEPMLQEVQYEFAQPLLFHHTPNLHDSFTAEDEQRAIFLWERDAIRQQYKKPYNVFIIWRT